MTLDHRALRRFLPEEGGERRLGRRLADRLAGLDVVGLRRRVAAVRDRLTVEANVARLTSLYACLTRLGGPSR